MSIKETELPRAVLFDWDNTLIENWRSIQAAMNAALADAGIAPFDMEQIKENARRSGRDSFPRVFGENWQQARQVFLDHFAQNHLAGLSVMPGAEELMDALESHRIPLGVVSNKQGEVLRREVAHLGWASRFVTVVGAQDAVRDKPDPAPVHFALKAFNTQAGPDVWLVGDTDIDMRAGVAAGCNGVLIGTEYDDPALLQGIEPLLKFPNCRSFAGFVHGVRTLYR